MSEIESSGGGAGSLSYTAFASEQQQAQTLIMQKKWPSCAIIHFCHSFHILFNIHCLLIRLFLNEGVTLFYLL